VGKSRLYAERKKTVRRLIAGITMETTYLNAIAARQSIGVPIRELTIVAFK
jgi:hypothetical protein